MYGFCTDHSKIAHAAVMKDYTYQNSDLILTIRNSLAGQELFDKVQRDEHKIEGKITDKVNEWNLGHEECHYFKFISSLEQ